jgi:hypothetical protein
MFLRSFILDPRCYSDQELACFKFYKNNNTKFVEIFDLVQNYHRGLYRHGFIKNLLHLMRLKTIGVGSLCLLSVIITLPVYAKIPVDPFQNLPVHSYSVSNTSYYTIEMDQSDGFLYKFIRLGSFAKPKASQLQTNTSLDKEKSLEAGLGLKLKSQVEKTTPQEIAAEKIIKGKKGVERIKLYVVEGIEQNSDSGANGANVKSIRKNTIRRFADLISQEDLQSFLMAETNEKNSYSFRNSFSMEPFDAVRLKTPKSYFFVTARVGGESFVGTSKLALSVSHRKFPVQFSVTAQRYFGKYCNMLYFCIQPGKKSI